MLQRGGAGCGAERSLSFPRGFSPSVPPSWAQLSAGREAGGGDKSTWRMEGETQCSAPPVWQPLGHTLSLLQWMSSWWPLPSLSGMIPTNICCPAVTINGVLLLLQACPSWDRQHHRDHSSIGIITPLQRQSNWGLESLYNLPLFTKPMADTSIWGQTLFLWASAVSSRKESDSLWSPHSLLEHRY